MRKKNNSTRPAVATEAVLLSATKQSAFNMFAEGKSIIDVSTATSRSAATVRDYLVEFIGTTQQSDPAPWVTEADFQRIREAARPIGFERLKPIFESLEGAISYDQIRIAVACLENSEVG